MSQIVVSVGLASAATFSSWYSFRDPNPNVSAESKAKAEKDTMFSNPSIAQLFAFATRDATVPLGILQAIAYASGRLQVENVPYFKTIMGLQIVGIVGGSLRAWCYRTLHKYFTFNLSVQEEQKIIETGPYKWLAHPSYLGSIFAVLGMGTLVGPLTPLVYLIPRRIIFDERILSNFQLVLEQRQMARLLLGLNYASFCYMCAGMFTRRVREEEAMMKKHFGSDYEAFLASRWRIFPGIL